MRRVSAESKAYAGSGCDWVTGCGYAQDQAQDLTQGFLTLLIEKNYLGGADRQRGRFRIFLQTAVKHFMANEWDRAHALKRGGGQSALSIDPVQAESWYAPELVEQQTPEDLFERRWAFTVLEHAMSRLRAEFMGTERRSQFDQLLIFLNGDPKGLGYEAVASELGTSPGALRVAVHRMRRRFRQLLRDEVAETVSEPEEIEEEIRFLISTVSNKS